MGFSTDWQKMACVDRQVRRTLRKIPALQIISASRCTKPSEPLEHGPLDSPGRWSNILEE